MQKTQININMQRTFDMIAMWTIVDGGPHPPLSLPGAFIGAYALLPLLKSSSGGDGAEAEAKLIQRRALVRLIYSNFFHVPDDVFSFQPCQATTTMPGIRRRAGN